jgi:hypothetical protein
MVVRLRRHLPLLAVAIFWLLSVLPLPAFASLEAGPGGAQEAFEGEAGRFAPTLAPKAGAGAHGNSRLSAKAQHGYEIVDTTTGEVVKTGVSGGARTASGGSVRASRQASAWNREAGQPGRYEPRVVKEVPEGAGARQKILDWEAENAVRLREAGQLNDPYKHRRP